MHPAVREARESDVEAIHGLVVELATYEKAAHEVKATPEHLRVALFGPQPAAYALVAEVDDEVVGLALYFLNFSTWEGVHGIYLEDLYVRADRRGSGLGKALLLALVEIAVQRGYARVEWSVLDWNTPAIDFYRALGAVGMEEWTVFRLTGPALPRLLGEAHQGEGAGDGQHEADPGDRRGARGDRIAEQEQSDR